MKTKSCVVLSLGLLLALSLNACGKNPERQETAQTPSNAKSETSEEASSTPDETSLTSKSSGSAKSDEKTKAGSAKEYQSLIDKLRPLHTPLGKPKPGEWLDKFKEPGQTFKQYVLSKPARPSASRPYVYIQPLGDFNEGQKAIVDQAGEFLGIFTNCEIKMQKTIPFSDLPEVTHRENPYTGDIQYLTTDILDKVLRLKLPKDAAAFIAFTAYDLYPEPSWNYVFGQASLSDRVGVWSIWRFGDPLRKKRLCLLRTIQLAGHETGHLFGIEHCTAYECTMCGCNSLAESDSRPLALCPECQAKICWAVRIEPPEYLKKMADFCRKNKLDKEADFFEEEIAALKAPAPKTPEKSAPTPP